MYPLVDLIVAVVKSYPSIFANPIVDVLYLLVLGLVAAQYMRVRSMETKIYGKPMNQVLGHTLVSMALGLLGGLAASVLLVVVGVTVTGSGIEFLLPVALVLFLFSPRFLCFSYAGGLLSLSYLIFGWPKVNVAALTGLVACLHAAEAFLIWVSGHGCATPLYIEGRDNRTVGAFSLQRFWPIPLIALFLVRVPDIGRVPGVISLPTWWPLVKAPEIAGAGAPLFQMIPIVAALGYGDLAMSRTPREKARNTSRHLFLYSAILLGFAIAASREPSFAWVAALFGPVGHEVVIRVGMKEETSREPRYVSSREGIVLLHVMDKGPASRAGLKSGYVLTEVQGIPVRSRAELEDALLEPGDLTILGRITGDSEPRMFTIPRNGAEALGVVPAPGLGDQPFVKAHSEGLLTRLFMRVFRRI